MILHSFAFAAVNWTYAKGQGESVTKSFFCVCSENIPALFFNIYRYLCSWRSLPRHSSSCGSHCPS